MGAEFGDTPWSTPAYNPARVGRQAGCLHRQLADHLYRAHSTLVSWWTTSQVEMTGPGSVVAAAPSGLDSTGANFSVNLEP